jgi:hypothetical protein
MLSLIHSKVSNQSVVGGLDVAPVKIIGGEDPLLIQLLFSGKTSGRVNKNAIIITYEILNKLFLFPKNLILKIFLDKMDNAIEERIINDIDAKTSSRINDELTYTPLIPIISTNTFISFLIKL